MTPESATLPTVARLRRTSGWQAAIVRWLATLAPLLLAAFVAAAFLADPAPDLEGPGLAVTLAVAGFAVAVLGRNATAADGGAGHVASVATMLVASVALAVLQPDGPGFAGLLVAVLCGVRLLPDRAAVPVLLVAFLTVEATAAVAGRGLADLAILAALAAFYGMLFLAFRLAEANRQAERLLGALERGRAAEAHAAGMAERQRLAREMHDVLAHSLAGLTLQLEAARMLAAEDPSDPRLAATLDRAVRLGKAGLEEARGAIGTLRDDALPGPERLPALADRFERDLGVPCRLTVTGCVHPLGSEARLAVYRVAQEALTNVVKHADAARVDVALSYRPTATRLTVEDVANAPAGTAVPEGRSGAGARDGGYGLTGMRERAELLGGTLTAAATPTGFRVELELPA